MLTPPNTTLRFTYFFRLKQTGGEIASEVGVEVENVQRQLKVRLALPYKINNIWVK